MESAVAMVLPVLPFLGCPVFGDVTGAGAENVRRADQALAPIVRQGVPLVIGGDARSRRSSLGR
jgi:hypothetical protein